MDAEGANKVLVINCKHKSSSYRDITILEYHYHDRQMSSQQKLFEPSYQ